MTNTQLLTQFDSLPEAMKQEVIDFIEFLKLKKKTKIKKRKFGCAKGMFTMHPDFDEPLDDFKEYM